MLLKIPAADQTNAHYALVGAIARVKASEAYGDNLYAVGSQAPSTKNYSTYRFVLRVQDSSLPPARKSSSGRRTVAASWEAHRDVMQAIFDKHPDAIIRTAITTYRGKADFEHRHADTYNHNVGSQMRPVAFGSL